MTRQRLPKVLAVVAIASGGCSSAPPPGTDGGVDAGCKLPSDFPPDADTSVVNFVCNCHENANVHCFEEGGPRCFGWACYLRKSADGGYFVLADGGYDCLC